MVTRKRLHVTLYLNCLFCQLFLQFVLSAYLHPDLSVSCFPSLALCLTSAMCPSTRQQSIRTAGQHFSIPRYALAQGKQHYLKLKVVSLINSTINNRIESTFSTAAGGGICCRRVHTSGAGESGRLRNDQKILAKGVSQWVSFTGKY
jgi:hypothetical protein